MEQLQLPMDLRTRTEKRAARRAARLRKQISSKPRNRCHDCGRNATECWIMPCLTLEIAIDKGERAVNEWAQMSDAPFRVEAAS